MDEKLTWNGQKKLLWKMNVKELQEKLQQLETEKMKQEMQARRFLGDLAIPMMVNRQAKIKGDAFNLKEARHRIACIKTILNVKLHDRANKNPY